MFNILYDQLPEEWEGYQINTWFQVGIQAALAFEDKTLFAYEKIAMITALLFENDDGSLREHPEGKDLEECIKWFLNGWNRDNHEADSDQIKSMDYYVDQWRIYADFRHFYGINLNEANLHWWEFNALLWNMPGEESTFYQVIEIRKKKITKKMDKETREQYLKAKKVYALEQPEKVYTPEQVAKIDAYDEMMRQRRGKKHGGI